MIEHRGFLRGDTGSIRTHTAAYSADRDNRADAGKQHQCGWFRHARLHVHAIEKDLWRHTSAADGDKA
jgi:hypothetical protein